MQKATEGIDSIERKKYIRTHSLPHVMSLNREEKRAGEKEEKTQDEASKIRESGSTRQRRQNQQGVLFLLLTALGQLRSVLEDEELSPAKLQTETPRWGGAPG